MKKTGFVFSLLMICSMNVSASDLPVTPEWGAAIINFEACTSDRHVAQIQIMISNFSSTDMVPEEGMIWATLEETRSAALDVFKANIPEMIAEDSDETVSDPSYFVALQGRPTTIHGELSDGRVGDWPVTLGEKNTLQTKMKLQGEGKYTALKVYFDPSASFVRVDAEKKCITLSKNGLDI